MFKKKSVTAQNPNEARILSGLVEGISLQGLQEEIEILRKVRELKSPKTRSFLEKKCLDLRHDFSKSKLILIDDESEEELVMSKKVEEAIGLVSKGEHWLAILPDLSLKEKAILLYYGMA